MEKRLVLACLLLLLSISTAEKLGIRISTSCSFDDMWVSVTSNGKPVEGASVALYSLGGGKKLVSETSTNNAGMAGFSRKPAGKYQVIAKTMAGGKGIAHFELEDCFYPEYGQADKKQGNSPQSIRNITISRGMVQREFEVFMLKKGSEITKYTEVTLNYIPKKEIARAALVEQIPASIASDTRMIGFYTNYPKSISQTLPITLRWDIGKVGPAKPVEIKYVINREITYPMASEFGKPVIESVENSEAGTNGGVGTAAALFDWQAPIEIGLLLLTGLAIVWMGIITYRFITAKN